MIIKVVIFSKNEETTIGSIIEEVKNYVNSVVVVNGHSSDSTLIIARAKDVKVLVDPGKGKGSAVRSAIDNINCDILLLMDADCSHRPEEIPKLISPLINGMADMVIASRFLGNSDEFHGTFLNLIRFRGNLLSNFLINLLWGGGRKAVTDCQNGYRAIKREIARQLNLRENGFAIEQEMVIKCLKKNFRIAEIPSHELKRKSGRSHIKPNSLYQYIKCFIVNLF